MYNILKFVLLGIGTLMLIFWVVLYFKNKYKYDDYIAAMDKKMFMMSGIYFIGFGFIDMFKINLRSKSGVDRQRKLAEIFGEKYAGYYHYCMTAAYITFFLTIVPLSIFGGFLLEILGAEVEKLMLWSSLIGVVIAVAMSADLYAFADKQVAEKRDEILSDFPEVLSKLALLVNAGMVFREAWATVSKTSDRALYKEMQLTSEDIRNGISEPEAYRAFAQRCGLKEIRKFASILTQNLQKASRDLTISLRQMSEESWEEKKHLVKRKGEKASTKLMIPLMIMFAGILFMIIVPLFANMF